MKAVGVNGNEIGKMLDMQKNLKDANGGVGKVDKKKSEFFKKNIDAAAKSGELVELNPQVKVKTNGEKTNSQILWPSEQEYEKFNKYYRYFMLVCNLYYWIVMVYRLSFEDKPTIGIVYLDFLMSFIYLIDMTRIFTSPFMNKNGKLETSYKLIFRRYA